MGHDVYIVCLFISYASPLILFYLYFFLTYILPYLSFSLRIDPLCFQAECRKRRLNLAVVFVMCLFCVVVHFFSLVNACCCCVRFGFLPYQAKRLAWRNSEMAYSMSSGTQNHDPIRQPWHARADFA